MIERVGIRAARAHFVTYFVFVGDYTARNVLLVAMGKDGWTVNVVSVDVITTKNNPLNVTCSYSEKTGIYPQ